MERIVIIGNGIAGVTLARHIRKKSDSKIIIVSSETEFFFSRTALMYVFMGHMKFEHTQSYENDFWKKNKIDLVQGLVTNVVPDSKEIVLLSKERIAFDKLVIATGSKSNKFGWPGQDLKGVTGLYHKQDLEALENWAPSTKRAVIVGGGLIGIELAEMLRSRNISVTFLVREKSFWGGVLPFGESQMINRHILEHHIDLRLDTNLVEILSDEKGHARAVVTDKGETIDCEIVGLTTGVSPNIDFLKDSGIELGKGVKVNRFLETNIKDIYAIGDCAEQHEAIDLRRPIEAVWYTGRMMGEVLAQTLTGTRTAYKPGHWFNSAKFLDIEYQTYGWVWAKAKEDEEQFYWEHKSGKKAIRISFDKKERTFLGINTFGIRMRHEFFDKVLTNKEKVDYVIHHLAEANFDPELFTSHTEEIQKQFISQFVSVKTI
ncbi:NAD(P)H-nitrite reductase large subunit [Flavobacterium sp. CG_23.5]|uniref:NAD(P)/FAD-dependent oxidoreductase n=1 Tax=unclassified Flavobacterium TaxID=196869 RepID=UPI0018C9FB6E|nr:MULTISPECIES: FAD/NAD(P)-binding oxidoreductase [unclassified Flavobacterium]MBG6109717.1 NAD(P)H-nitrite reductase large subunit [Flavobacterium sp. CG_9.10]MBP2284751.1 NAD(P)H-nitrite reductase large subunit [Flavobacterium sp. CG_23.5]